jgi:uncharacterized OB-fold protein
MSRRLWRSQKTFPPREFWADTQRCDAKEWVELKEDAMVHVPLLSFLRMNQHPTRLSA